MIGDIRKVLEGESYQGWTTIEHGIDTSRIRYFSRIEAIREKDGVFYPHAEASLGSTVVAVKGEGKVRVILEYRYV